ncbi:hypothetical protein [Xylanimonas ulmi]|nr:hypothetical protein [Xylanibacterium ulmi]
MALLNRVTPRFGWEEASLEEMHDDVYVHQNLTNRAYREYAAGRPGYNASLALEWHTDYIDSYLYNPLFWAGGFGSGDGLDRLKVATALTHELESLHFDDLTSGEQVASMWTRYLSGCVAGLYWAAENDDVAAAHNILGAAFHAMQDFYSHSNWVDNADRRTVTWHGATAQVRGAGPLYTGSYETPKHLTQKPHGRVSFECSLLQASGVGPLVDLVCGPLSPLYRQSPCQVYERCGDAAAVRTSVLGVELPRGLVYLDPPGIALDSSWQAEIGRQLRDIPQGDPITARELFARAKDLAVESTVWWLRSLEGELGRDPVTKAFWQRVVTADTYGSRRAQFEDFSRLPLLFVGHGEYPPSGRGSDWDWYLRLQIRTSSETDSGTNGSVKVHADGQTFLLDYAKNSQAIVEYNDFSTGDVQSYVVGPLRRLPSSITFEVEGNDVGDILGVIWDGFVGALETVVDAVGDLLLTLIGGHADHVATRKLLWGPDELAGIGPEPRPFSVFLDGDSEGQYNVYGTIRRGPDDGLPHRHHRYVVRLDELECWEESFLHLGQGASEEPFLLAALVNLADPDPQTRVNAFRTQPYPGVGRRDRVAIGHEFTAVVPDAVGMLALPMSVWESDHETAAERDRILREFAGHTEQDTRSWSDRLIETVGATFGSDWKLGGLRAFAFTRAPFGSRAATVYPPPGDAEPIERWVDAGSRLEIALNTTPQWRTWDLPDGAQTILDFSALAESAFAAGDLDDATGLVQAGADRLRDIWARHPDVPFTPVLAAVAAWRGHASRHHPHDVPGQVAAARNAWLLAELVGRHLVSQPTPPQAELTALAASLGPIASLLTFGTPDAEPSAVATRLLCDVYDRMDGDHRIDIGVAWATLSLRRHETAFHPAVADRDAELRRQREAAGEALAVLRPVVTGPGLASHPAPQLRSAARSLRLLVGTATFGSGDSTDSVEANDLAQAVWPLLDGDLRVEAAETWMGLALRHHEVSFHPACPDAKAEQARQRAAAARSLAILEPVVEHLPNPAISDAQVLQAAATLRRLIGLATFGAPTSEPSERANARAQQAWRLVAGDRRIDRGATWTDLALRHHEISVHPDCPDPRAEQRKQRESAAHAVTLLLDVAADAAVTADAAVATAQRRRLDDELRRVQGLLIWGLADGDPDAARLRRLHERVGAHLAAPGGPQG